MSEIMAAQMLFIFEPTPQHCVIPTFRWRAIVTTNYDDLIEDAYRGDSASGHRSCRFLKTLIAGIP